MLNKALDRKGKYESNSEAAFSSFMSPETLLHNDRVKKNPIEHIPLSSNMTFFPL